MCPTATTTSSTSSPAAPAITTARGAARPTTALENTVYAYNDDFTWIRGHHTFKFGGFQINHYNGFGRQCEAGCVGFSYQETGVPGGSNPNVGGNAFASFLLGYADSGSIDTVRFIGQQFYYVAGYAQDDWKVSDKLVLNLGVRYDINLPPTGLANRWSDFSPPPLTRRPAEFPARSSSPVPDRALWAAAPWPIYGPKASARISASPIPRTRRP